MAARLPGAEVLKATPLPTLLLTIDRSKVLCPDKGVEKNIKTLERFQTFKQYYGPTMNAFEAASKDGKADQLETELTHLFEGHNLAGTDSTEIPATFLKVTVTKP